MLSIIIPVYNVEKYLERCLDSILNQRGSYPFEIIIVNDGSPDDSQKIIDRYAKKYPEIVKTFTQENSGVSAARNYGLKNISGDYVTFIDPDDYIYENYLETINNYLKNTRVDMIIFDYNFIDVNNNEVIKKIFVNNNHYILGKQASWTRVVRSELYKGVFFPEGIIYEDLALIPFLVAKAKSANIIYVNKPLYAYTVDAENSIMNTYNKKIFDIYPALENLFDLFKQEGIYEQYREELHYLALEHLCVGHGYRLLRYPSKKLKDFQNIALFMESNFGADWQKNKFIKQKIQKQNIASTMALIVPLYLKMFKLIFSSKRGAKK